MNNMLDKIINSPLIVFVAMMFAFAFGAFLATCERNNNNDSIFNNVTNEDVQQYRDTVLLRDTVLIDKPRYVNTNPLGVRYMLLPRWSNHDTVTVRDSVEVAIAVEQRHYAGDDYDAWVSGYSPELDSIRIYRENNMVTQTQYITKYKSKRWGISVNVGYGITPHGVEPYLGVGLSYMFMCF